MSPFVECLALQAKLDSFSSNLCFYRLRPNMHRATKEVPPTLKSLLSRVSDVKGHGRRAGLIGAKDVSPRAAMAAVGPPDGGPNVRGA